MMKSGRLARRLALVAGGSAIVAMGALTAGCSGGEKPSPSSTTPTTTSVSPTEKSIDPTGGNKFTPPVIAPPAPTAIPGTHRN
jgi:hypothetical protein